MGLLDRATEQENRTNDLRFDLEDIRSKLIELSNFSRHTIDDAQAAKDLNVQSRRKIETIQVGNVVSIDCSWFSSTVKLDGILVILVAIWISWILCLNDPVMKFLYSGIT